MKLEKFLQGGYLTASVTERELKKLLSQVDIGAIREDWLYLNNGSRWFCKEGYPPGAECVAVEPDGSFGRIRWPGTKSVRHKGFRFTRLRVVVIEIVPGVVVRLEADLD